VKILGRPRCPFCQTVLVQAPPGGRGDSTFECRACGVVFKANNPPGKVRDGDIPSGPVQND
jgi:hypothetical protein